LRRGLNFLTGIPFWRELRVYLIALFGGFLRKIKMRRHIFLIEKGTCDDENDNDDDENDHDDDCDTNNHYYLCRDTSLPQLCTVRFRDIDTIQDQIFENSGGIVPVPLIGVKCEVCGVWCVVCGVWCVVCGVR
jgi:hypothetical protein